MPPKTVVKKTEIVAQVVNAVKPRHPFLSAPVEGLTLLEQGLVLVLLRTLTRKQAEQSVRSLKHDFEDWNEVRVSQCQEIALSIHTSSRKKGPALLNDRRDSAMLVRAYLQDVFQEVHSLDLEFLREDSSAGMEALRDLRVLGLAGGAWLVWASSDGKIPVHSSLMKLLDKLGWISRTTSVAKASEMIEGLISEGGELDFTLAVYEMVDRWNDLENPVFAEVEILRKNPYGKKAYEDWVRSRERAAEQARKEEARRLTAEKRESERIAKEQEKEQKRVAAAELRKNREKQRQRKAKERRLAAEQKKAQARRDAAKKIADKQREVERKAQAKKKAADEKKIAAKKAAAKKIADQKAAVKKEVARKAAAKKEAARKAVVAKKAAAAKKVAEKKAAAKKAAAKKVAAKKAAQKGKTAGSKKKPSAKKKSASKKKPSAKKPSAKKKSASKKKPSARKTSSKKRVSKRGTSAKKKTRRKTARRR
ncbi:MAG TPA: hypothetical protein EYQ25_03830 [Planctomycetes bacterium]|nr:hypothetical protein [Planctomycetota bacterium]HIL36059.1 hypothetical protein [Planctomycetota bacterium]